MRITMTWRAYSHGRGAVLNLLLDTHVALWAITDSPNLPQKARDMIQSLRTTVWVSAANVWETAIKHALG